MLYNDLIKSFIKRVMDMDFYNLADQQQIIQNLVASQNTVRTLGLTDLLTALQSEFDRYSKVFHLHNKIDKAMSEIMKVGFTIQSSENSYLKDCVSNYFDQLKCLGVIYK